MTNVVAALPVDQGNNDDDDGENCSSRDEGTSTTQPLEPGERSTRARRAQPRPLQRQAPTEQDRSRRTVRQRPTGDRRAGPHASGFFTAPLLVPLSRLSALAGCRPSRRSCRWRQSKRAKIGHNGGLKFDCQEMEGSRRTLPTQVAKFRWNASRRCC
ncbi:hypothetical protein EMEDMD4_160018 [Sinorhizobium medicae]|uniref:Uncharacterized protein n=1 Tax=Sinorhizobium medicae TaxID=110321 RepID=A0A508WSD5_9HYPH|nr:hypothetical protein EMEDMD4_160018 [Sinorhizobium medicae]